MTTDQLTLLYLTEIRRSHWPIGYLSLLWLIVWTELIYFFLSTLCVRLHRIQISFVPFGSGVLYSRAYVVIVVHFSWLSLCLILDKNLLIVSIGSASKARGLGSNTRLLRILDYLWFESFEWFWIIRVWLVQIPTWLHLWLICIFLNLLLILSLRCQMRTTWTLQMYVIFDFNWVSLCFCRAPRPF